jgi:hypothetical protein
LKPYAEGLILTIDGAIGLKDLQHSPVRVLADKAAEPPC